MADESGTSSEELTLESNVVVQRPRRRALWGVLAAVALAAGALAVTAGGDDDELPTLPVALGAATAETDSAAGSAAPMAGDLRMAWVTYLAGDDLPALGGEGPAYRLSGAVDEDRVRALAESLGIEGDLRQEDGYWHIEGDDAVLEVYEGGSWWYSIQQYEVLPAEGGGGSPGCEPGPAVDCGVVEPVPADAPPPTTIVAGGPNTTASCTTREAADGTKVEECVATDEPCPPDGDCPVPLPTPIEPQPPADLPSEDAAREIALDLLRSTGMDLDDAKVTVDGPYEAWYVNVEPTIDGLPVSGLSSMVAVGSKGAITNATGNLATPELIGDYPLIDTRAAIERLNEQQGSWFGYGTDVPLGAPGTASSRPAVAIAEDPAVGGCAEQPDGTEACTFEDVGQPIECVETGALPPEGDDVATTIVSDCTYPEPEPVEITLHDAERVLVWLPSLDGSTDSYLLSGYRFSGDDGAIVEIAAVADESLAPTTTVPEPDTTIPPEEPTNVDPSRLEPGQEPELGVGYYVDVDVACAAFRLGDEIWRHDVGDLAGWSTPHEGGTFTLDAPDHGTFVGDHAEVKTATFVTGTDPDGCTPTPRP